MRIDAGEIGVRNRILVERAVIDIPSNGITVIEGGNGTGKTLLLRKLFRSVDDLGVLASYVEQDNDYLLPRSGIIAGERSGFYAFSVRYVFVIPVVLFF